MNRTAEKKLGDSVASWKSGDPVEKFENRLTGAIILDSFGEHARVVSALVSPQYPDEQFEVLEESILAIRRDIVYVGLLYFE